MNHLNLCILAAGEGRRARDVTGNTPKSIYPLNQNADCLLSINLKEFLVNQEFSFENIVIVGGYQFSMFDRRVNSIIDKLEIHNLPIEIIDASPQWEQGPVYSFISSKKGFSQISPNSPIIVCAGDTYYSPKFLNFIRNSVNFDFNSTEIPSVLLFSTEQCIPRREECSTFILEKQVIYRNSNSEKVIVPLESYFSSSDTKTPKVVEFIIPLLILNSEILAIVENELLESKKTYKKLIDVLLECEKQELLSISTISYTSDEILAEIYYDCDFGDDLKYILNLLKSNLDDAEIEKI